MKTFLFFFFFSSASEEEAPTLLLRLTSESRRRCISNDGEYAADAVDVSDEDDNYDFEMMMLTMSQSRRKEKRMKKQMKNSIYRSFHTEHLHSEKMSIVILLLTNKHKLFHSFRPFL